jgi:hypothetical protein
MTKHLSKFAATAFTVVIAGAAAMWTAAASAAPIAITWADLIPASAIIGDKVHELSGTVQHGQVSAAPENVDGSPTKSIEELLGISSGVAYRKDLDQKEVKISGFLLPLAFNGTKVSQFLLVPFVGACIHVPPPPANQIIYVKVEHGLDVKGTFDPVWVTGTLKVTPTFTGLADAGYSLDAEKVEPRPGG